MAYIEAKKACFGYKKDKMLLKDLSLEVFHDDITAIVGHNGGGKTTLGKLLTGIYKPQWGDVCIDNINTKTLSLGQIGRKIGYLFQNPCNQLFAGTVEEEIYFPMKLMGISQESIINETNRILDFFELSHLKTAFPLNLSHGEKQRLALAAIFVNKPGFLVLDEPTTGLDQLRKQRLSYYLNELKKQGVGIIIISHDEEFVDNHATRRIVMARGEIVEDTR